MTPPPSTERPPPRTTRLPTIRISQNCIAAFRPLPICAGTRATGCRISPSNTCDGGAGADGGIARNWAAFDAVELVPRYGVTTALPPVDVTLFGRRYSAPIGVAPMGGPSLVWPGADQYLAAAAQRARVPYTLGLVGGMTVEHAAEIAPDVLWFQLYRCSRNEHAIGFDLVKRADAAGVHVLVLTLDVPVRTTRSREVAVGISSPFRPDLRMMAGIVTSPGYLKSLVDATASRASAISSPIPRTQAT